MFRENSLMLHGHPNHFGVPSATAQDRLFDCALPPTSVGLAQDDRNIRNVELFCSTFRR